MPRKKQHRTRTVTATFVKDGKWWVVWTDDIPGAMSQGRTIREARENLLDAIRELEKPMNIANLPAGSVVIEKLRI